MLRIDALCYLRLFPLDGEPQFAVAGVIQLLVSFLPVPVDHTDFGSVTQLVARCGKPLTHCLLPQRIKEICRIFTPFCFTDKILPGRNLEMYKLLRYLTKIIVKILQRPLRKLMRKVEIITIQVKIGKYLLTVYMIPGHTLQDILIYSAFTGEIMILVLLVIW